jgi:hypothetical protein
VIRFLQATDAQPSVLSGYVKARAVRNQGQRVVAGQLLMQAANDIFLGCQRVPWPDGVERDYYLRQPRDGKGPHKPAPSEAEHNTETPALKAGSKYSSPGPGRVEGVTAAIRCRRHHDDSEAR